MLDNVTLKTAQSALVACMADVQVGPPVKILWVLALLSSMFIEKGGRPPFKFIAGIRSFVKHIH